MAKRSQKKKAVVRKASTRVSAKGDCPQGLPSWLSHEGVWGLILILAVIVVYQPVWYAGYIWDDDQLVTANPVIVGPLGLKEIWTTNAADICPLTLTTFWMEHALWGLAPLPYHLVNVLLHGACAVVLWRVLRALQIPGAWLGAALWALHPVEVESAAWITETKNTESGLFFLLSILFFVKGLKNQIGWNYAYTLLFAALAMASKSSTVMLPVVLGLCAWWMEGRWQWRNLVRLIPIILMSVVASAASIWTQKQHAFAGDTQGARSWPERLVTAGDAVWFYLGKLLWPHPLIAVYPRWQIDAGAVISYLPLLVVIIALVILWLKRESWSRPCFFAFTYFLAVLVPVMGLMGMNFFYYSFVADHFQYLASMGPLALIGAGLAWFSNAALPGKRWLQSSLCAALLLLLGVLSWRQAWTYENEETLWSHTLAWNPNCWVGHNFLGIAYFQKGQTDEAVEQYQKALEINSNDADSLDNLGVALFKKGQVDQAMIQYQRALKINPNDTEAYCNLGTILLRNGQVDEAMTQYQKALKINPNDAEAYCNLGCALLQKGQVDEAMNQYQKTLKINPNYAEAYCNLGAILLRKGQVDEAMTQYQKALEINPNDAETHNNLGAALAQRGQLDKAIVQFQEASRLKPDNSDVQKNLARAMTQQRADVK